MDSGPEPKRAVLRVERNPVAADAVQTPSGGPDLPKERRPRRAVDVPLSFSVLGSILAAFGPLLPWWKVSTIQMGIQVSTITGTGVWPGIVAFAGGFTALATCAYIYAKPGRRDTLGLVVVGAGAVAFMGSALAVTNRAHLVVTSLRVGNRIGLSLSLVGGLIAATGGYLLTREVPDEEGPER